MLTAQAAWEITSSGSTFEVSDGDWILQCQNLEAKEILKSVLSENDSCFHCNFASFFVYCI
jgi:hypothetical protein